MREAIGPGWLILGASCGFMALPLRPPQAWVARAELTMENRSALRWLLPLCAVAGGIVAIYSCQPVKETEAVKTAGLSPKHKSKAAQGLKRALTPKKPRMGQAQEQEAPEEEKKPQAEGTGDWYNQDCSSCVDKACATKEFDINEICPPSDKECRAVLDCGMKNNCITAVHGAAPCYCGSLIKDMVDCQDSTSGKDPDGPCRDVFEQYADAATSEEVMKRWYDRNYGMGRANFASACYSERCVGSCVPDPDKALREKRARERAAAEG